MICNLTIGATVVELAGGLGRTSETSGLTINIEPSFERVAYIGVNEARQYARPGASVSVSFDSSQTFSTLNEAETYILGLPGDLIDQTGATAVIGHETSGMVITGTLTSNGTTPAVPGGLAIFGTVNGKSAYSTGDWVLQWVVDYPTLGTNSWRLIDDGGTGAAWYSTSAVATPDLAASWTAVSPATGTPTVTAGIVITPSLTIYDAEAIVSAAHQGATVRLSVSISGRITSP